MGIRASFRRRNKLKKQIKMETGAELIAKERKEQIEKHKWTEEHDKEHTEGQLKFASLYALGEKSKLQPCGWASLKIKLKD